MASICACCDLDLCETCGHHCECQHLVLRELQEQEELRPASEVRYVLAS